MTSRVELLERANELESSRTPFVWATVVRVEHPTSAKPGDAALVLGDGAIEGFVGGACAEATVRAQAVDVLAGGHARLVRISPGGEPDVEERPGEVNVVNPCLSGGTLEIFLEPAIPPPLVVVFGEGPIARALERASELFDQQVRRTTDPAAELPPDAAAVVVASHGRHEEEVLARALEAGIPYVGLVASRRRGSAVIGSLPVDDDRKAAVRTPAGLDIGARTPGEVALSILADIVSHRPRPSPRAEPEQAEPSSRTATDPVCGMSVAAVDTSLHADVDGVRVWFCGPGCREAFLDDPARYAS